MKRIVKVTDEMSDRQRASAHAANAVTYSRRATFFAGIALGALVVRLVLLVWWHV